MSAMTREPALLKKLTEQAETHAIELRAYEATVANLNERIAGHNDALAFMKDNSDRIQQEFIARINAANERIRQLEAERDGMALVPRELLDKFPELNTSNYGPDDVDELNAWGIELVLAAAPQPKKESDNG